MRIIIISTLLLFSAISFAQELPPKLLSIITNDFADFRITDRSDFSPQFHVLKSEGFDLDKYLKPSGEPGMSDEKYFNGPDSATYPFLHKYTQDDINRYEKAILKYTNLNVLEKTKLTYLPHLATDDLFYCKESYYFENGKFINLQKCD